MFADSQRHLFDYIRGFNHLVGLVSCIAEKLRACCATEARTFYFGRSAMESITRRTSGCWSLAYIFSLIDMNQGRNLVPPRFPNDSYLNVNQSEVKTVIKRRTIPELCIARIKVTFTLSECERKSEYLTFPATQHIQYLKKMILPWNVLLRIVNTNQPFDLLRHNCGLSKPQLIHIVVHNTKSTFKRN